MVVPSPGRRGAALRITWLQVAQEFVTAVQQLWVSGTGGPKAKLNMRRLE